MEESPPDRYGVVGFPVGHSKSPFIHGMFARQTAQNMEYRLYEIPPVAFRTEVGRFFAEGGSGLNVTVPHKVAAADFAAELTPRAERAGAVNTLAMKDGKVLGDNTDGAGLVRDLSTNLQIEMEGKRVLVGEMRRSGSIDARAEDQQLFRVIAEAIPYPMLLLNATEQQLIACNQRAAEVLGWPTSAMIGQKVDSLFVDANDCRQLLLMVRTQGAIKDFETCLRTASEQRIWGLVSARKSSHRGESVILLGVNDITERKRAEEALRDSEARYRAILETTTEGYVLISLGEGNITDVNPALCRLLGVRRQDILGLQLDRFVVRDNLEEWHKQYAKFSASQHRQFELRLHAADGAEVHMSPEDSMDVQRALQSDIARRRRRAGGRCRRSCGSPSTCRSRRRRRAWKRCASRATWRRSATRTRSATARWACSSASRACAVACGTCSST